MEKSVIIGLFEEWNSALQTGEPKQVASLYETNAILLPTVSNKVRHNHEEIEDYFVHFLAKGPQGKIDEANVRTFGSIAIKLAFVLTPETIFSPLKIHADPSLAFTGGVCQFNPPPSL